MEKFHSRRQRRCYSRETGTDRSEDVEKKCCDRIRQQVRSFDSTSEGELPARASFYKFVYEKYNFRITDLDEPGYIYMVNYNQLDSSFWDSIWGDAIPVIQLPDGDYEFKLSRLENKTAISLVDDQGRVLNQQTLNDIFDVMGPALSFN